MELNCVRTRAKTAASFSALQMMMCQSMTLLMSSRISSRSALIDAYRSSIISISSSSSIVMQRWTQ